MPKSGRKEKSSMARLTSIRPATEKLYIHSATYEPHPCRSAGLPDHQVLYYTLWEMVCILHPMGDGLYYTLWETVCTTPYGRWLVLHPMGDDLYYTYGRQLVYYTYGRRLVYYTLWGTACTTPYGRWLVLHPMGDGLID